VLSVLLRFTDFDYPFGIFKLIVFGHLKFFKESVAILASGRVQFWEEITQKQLQSILKLVQLFQIRFDEKIRIN